jgi:hypothetical protein
MTLSIFGDKATAPTDRDLQAALGPTYALWTRLIALVGNRLEALAPVWKFAGKTTGWGLRLVYGERVILYMTPQTKQFLVSVALGERAVTAARAARLPAEIQRAIEAAPRYAEGRGVRIPVRTAAQLPGLARLARIKHEN